MVIQVYSLITNAEKIVEVFYEGLQDLLEVTPKIDVLFLFIVGDCNAKVRSQGIPGITGKFVFGVQNEAGQRLTEYRKGNAKVITNTLFQQNKRWASPDGQYCNHIDDTLCSQRQRSSIQSAKTKPGANCGSEHELCIVKFRLKLKKVGKTTRSLSYCCYC